MKNPRQKHTKIAPPTRKPKRYHDSDWTTAVGEVAVVATPDDLPDWLVGAN